MKKKHIFYLLTLLILISFSCQSQFTLNDLLRFGVDADKFYVDEVTLPQPKKEWTIMLYLAADNNLSHYSLLDVNEVLSVGGSTSIVNVVAMWDKPAYGGGWDPLDTHEALHGYYYIGRTKSILVKDITTDINTGNPQTGKDFIDFVNTNFSANHYMFVFWDHGAGVDKSSLKAVDISKTVCDDFTSGDALSSIEQKDIINRFKTTMGKNLDIVAYDACLMGMAEIMYQYRGLADYFIGSEDIIPGTGYNYKFVNEARTNFSISSYDLALSAVNYYKSYYSNISDITLSLIDLSNIGSIGSLTGLGQLLDNFGTAAQTYDNGNQIIYKNALATTNKFDPGYPFYDLNDYMNKIYPLINPSVKPYAQAIIDYLNNGNLIKIEVHNPYHTTATARGISIMLDTPTSIYQSNHDLCDGVGGDNTSWDEFLNWLAF